MSSELRRDRPTEQEGVAEIDMWSLVEVLWRRRTVMALCLVLFSALGVVLALSRPRVYRAVSVLRVVQRADGVHTADWFLAVGGEQTVQTHAALIQSQDVVEAALSSLPSAQRDKFPKRWQQVPISVASSREAPLLEISALAADSDAAIALANAVASSYVQYVEQSNRETTSAVVQALEPAIATAGQNHEKAQEQLAAYRKETGIYDYDVEYESILAALADVRRSSPEALVRTGIADVERDLAGQQAALAEANQLLKNASGGATTALRESADAQRVAIAASKAKLEELRQEERALLSRLERFNELGAETRAFEFHAETKREIYDALHGKLQQIIADLMTQLPAVQVSSAARPPLELAGTPRRLVVMSGMIVGLLLGLGLALVMEAVERRSQGVQARGSSNPLVPE